MKELSKRRTDKLARKETDKQVRKLGKEYNETHLFGRGEYIDLDEPLRMGFERNLVLISSAMRRSDFEVLESILPLINTRHCRSTRDFRTYDEKTKKRNKEFVHRSKALHRKEFDKLTERQKAYFDPFWIYSRWGGEKGGWYEYRFIYEHYLTSKMSKWHVWRVPVLDPDGQSRHDELRNIMYGAKYLMRKVDRILHYRWNYRDYDEDIYHKKLKRVDLREAQQSLLFNDYDDDDSMEFFYDNYYESAEHYNAYHDEEWWLDIGFFKHFITIERA